MTAWWKIAAVFMAVALGVTAFSTAPSCQKKKKVVRKSLSVWEKANLGDSAAQYDVAVRYATGNGVDKDLEESARWMKESASGGYPQAQYEYGEILYNAQSQSRDFRDAAVWFNRAAHQDVPEAQYMMGTMTADGLGVEQDYIRGYMWLSLSVKSLGEPRRSAAAEALSKLSSRMSPDAVAYAQDLASKWTPVREAQKTVE